MSRIFEALQHSESELRGEDLETCDAAADLVLAAEKRTGSPVTDRADTEVRNGQPVDDLIPDVEERVLPKPVADNLTHVSNIRSVASPESRLISENEAWSLAAEKFRLLAVRLRHIRQRRSIKKVLITSTLSEEGKSFVSANLALTLARKRDQKVLLIEGDLRRPVLSKKFGIGELPGLTQSLAAHGTPVQNIYHLEDQRLWLLPAGAPVHNPLELMQAGKLAAMLEQLSSLFDWILIDSPPLIPLADTILWSRLVDGVLLVARQGKTAKRPLKRALEMIDRTTLLGVVLNSCSDSDHHSYYGRYGYRYITSTDTEPKTTSQVAKNP